MGQRLEGCASPAEACAPSTNEGKCLTDCSAASNADSSGGTIGFVGLRERCGEHACRSECSVHDSCAGAAAVVDAIRRELEGPLEDDVPPSDRSVLFEGDLPVQDHLFAFDGDLTPTSRQSLYAQFDKLPTPRLVEHARTKALAPPNDDWVAEPPQELSWGTRVHPRLQLGANTCVANQQPDWIQEQWRHKGLQAMRKGHVAVVMHVPHETLVSKVQDAPVDEWAPGNLVASAAVAVARAHRRKSTRMLSMRSFVSARTGSKESTRTATKDTAGPRISVTSVRTSSRSATKEGGSVPESTSHAQSLEAEGNEANNKEASSSSSSTSGSSSSSSSTSDSSDGENKDAVEEIRPQGEEAEDRYTFAFEKVDRRACRLSQNILKRRIQSEFGCSIFASITPTLDIGLLSRKSLFQIFLERVKRLRFLAAKLRVKDKSNSFIRCTIPVYIVCSNTAEADTAEAFVRSNGCFGLPGEDLRFLGQEDMPLVDKKGRYLLRGTSEIWAEPRGSGGVYPALRDNGALMDMKERLIQQVYIFSADNLLCRVADPVLIGFAQHTHGEVVGTCVERFDMDSSHRLFCTCRPRPTGDAMDGEHNNATIKQKQREELRPRVLGLEELQAADSNRRIGDCNGRFQFHASVLCQLVLSMHKLDWIASAAHEAHFQWRSKAVQIDCVSPDTGKMEVRNASYLHLWAEDVLNMSHRPACLVVPAREQVALIQERKGPRSPQAAALALSIEHQRWLEASGARFCENERTDVAGANLCEVSPLVSYAGEGLKQLYVREFRLPLHIESRYEHEAAVPAMNIAFDHDEDLVELPAHLNEDETDALLQELVAHNQMPFLSRADREQQNASDSEEDLNNRSQPTEDTAIIEFAPSSEFLDEDPLEEQRFLEAQAYAERCMAVKEKVLSGNWRKDEINVKELMDLVRDHDERVDDEDEPQFFQASRRRSNDDEGSSEDNDLDGDPEEEVKSSSGSSGGGKNGEKKVKKKKGVKKYIFTGRSGLKNKYYVAARGVRERREKVLGAAYCVGLQKADMPKWRQVAKKSIMAELWRDWNPRTVYSDDWKYRIKMPGTEKEYEAVGARVYVGPHKPRDYRNGLHPQKDAARKKKAVQPIEVETVSKTMAMMLSGTECMDRTTGQRPTDDQESVSSGPSGHPMDNQAHTARGKLDKAAARSAIRRANPRGKKRVELTEESVKDFYTTVVPGAGRQYQRRQGIRTLNTARDLVSAGDGATHEVLPSTSAVAITTAVATDVALHLTKDSTKFDLQGATGNVASESNRAHSQPSAFSSPSTQSKISKTTGRSMSP